MGNQKKKSQVPERCKLQSLHSVNNGNLNETSIKSINCRGTWVGGSRSKERDRKSELVLDRQTKFFERDRNNSDRKFYNVVRYVHIPLVPRMQERSEAERRAIWRCLNVATWRRERSDRAIQQIR